MSKGFPDYRLSVDLSSQSLAQLQNRETYGGARFAEVSGAVAASTENPVLAISGKGMVYITFLWITSIATQQNDYIKLIIDGEAGTLPTFKQLLDNNFSMQENAEGSLTFFDNINFRIGAWCGRGCTFESSLVVYYVETHGRNPVATAKMKYALISP